MKIQPIVNKDIIGRYRKTANKIIDVFTNQTILKSNNNKKLNKKLNQLNTIGLINAQRIDNNQAQLLYVLV